LCVSAGDRVEAKQVVAVVESMKMQIEMRAPEAGLVEMVNGSSDRDVDQGEELLSLRPVQTGRPRMVGEEEQRCS
jgi:urea carboxylase